MSDNEEVSLIRTKKPHKNLKAVNAMPPEEPKVTMPEPKVAMSEPKEAMSEPKVKKQRPPKTEKQLEASKKMLEARRLQCQKIKEEKLARQYEAFKKVENKCVVPPTHATGRMGCPHTEPVKAPSDTEDTEEEEEIIVVKKPSLKKKKKKIVIVQQSESEDDESEEEEKEIIKPTPKPNFGKSQQNIKSKITVGNQKPNWENYFC
jgi:hypothetical protein